MRVVFVTDLHGSSLAFQKALRATKHFEADILIVGGDLSGKRLVPIIPKDGGYIVSEPHVLRAEDASDKGAVQRSHVMEDTTSTLHSIAEGDLDYWRKRLECKGYYWHIASSEEIDFLNESRAELQRLLSNKILDRLLQWSVYANQALGSVCCLWTGGNDDEEELINDMCKRDLGKFICGDGKVIEIDGFEILSLGYSNITPFNTSRELTEFEIRSRLDDMVKEVKSRERLLLNVHVPPAECGVLDLVPDPENPRELIHVGSSAVRSFIEDVQPLADFAGHVPEGKGMAIVGRTYVFNPGSDYQAGILHGYVVNVSRSKIVDYAHFAH